MKHDDHNLPNPMPQEHVHIDPEAPLSQAVADGKAAREAAKPANMFDGIDNATELIGQAIGAGSMCWENVAAAGEFDSTRASKIVDDALAQLSTILRKAGLR